MLIVRKRRHLRKLRLVPELLTPISWSALAASCANVQGRYRLARLAAKFGPEIPLPDLLNRLTADCEARNARHPYRSRCVARFIDLDPPRRPPDAPSTVLKVVAGGKR